MAVSVTYTLEAGYGSKIVVPGGGFLLNNEMGDFNAGPGITNDRGLIGTEPNLARPEQRMLSSMTPTILAKDGELVAVVGSPGGRTIINSVLEVVLNVVDFGMDMHEAVSAKRFHHQWLPDDIRIEAEGVTPATLAGLEAMGHTASMGGSQGRTHCIMVDAETGILTGSPRSTGPGRWRRGLLTKKELILSEEQARRLWERAALLQSEADQREAGREWEGQED